MLLAAADASGSQHAAAPQQDVQTEAAGASKISAGAGLEGRGNEADDERRRRRQQPFVVLAAEGRFEHELGRRRRNYF